MPGFQLLHRKSHCDAGICPACELDILRQQVASITEERDRLKAGKHCPICGNEPQPSIPGPMAICGDEPPYPILICAACAETVADFYGRARERKRAEQAEEERDRLKAENRTLRNTCVTLEEVAESRRLSLLKKTSVCPSCEAANPQPGF